MVEFVEGEDVIYEINEKGERKIIKSTESVKRAYVRFTNYSSRPVEVLWRDFNGIRRRYTRLAPGAFCDINTYLTHPWEFTDADTAEHFVVNNNLIFRAPANIADMRFRTNWNITVPVRSLRYSAMLVIALWLPNNEMANQLDLPRPLASDLILLRSCLKIDSTTIT